MSTKEILQYLDQAASHAAMAYEISKNDTDKGKALAYMGAAKHIRQTIEQRHAENMAALNRKPDNPETK